MQRGNLYAASLAFIAGASMAASPAWAEHIKETATAGAYKVTLMVLPAESFSGPDAKMVRDGGADPNMIGGPTPPDHHLVVFVSKNGHRVKDANVSIDYREVSPSKSDWQTLKVARMHVAGKSLKTTHYGNNLALGPGRYKAAVSVNGSDKATFRFRLS